MQQQVLEMECSAARPETNGAEPQAVAGPVRSQTKSAASASSSGSSSRSSSSVKAPAKKKVVKVMPLRPAKRSVESILIAIARRLKTSGSGQDPDLKILASSDQDALALARSRPRKPSLGPGAAITGAHIFWAFQTLGMHKVTEARSFGLQLELEDFAAEVFQLSQEKLHRLAQT